MARLSERLSENVAGELYVDASCIDCDLCRQIAPATFTHSSTRDQSIVHAQPQDPAARERALMALVTCPTASIGTARKAEVRAAARRFPEPIADDVYFCGYASADSYGAASYLIRRPDGNVLIDSPRAAPTLLDRIDELGGVRWLFLTHRDDVADHEKLHRRFGCERILHAADVGSGTRGVERQPRGDENLSLAEDLLLVPTPGHTRGSMVLLHRAFLFSGDHLWGSDDQRHLEAGRGVCWFSWDAQRASVKKLRAFDFLHVLPGHGRRMSAPSAETMREEMDRLAMRMR